MIDDSQIRDFFTVIIALSAIFMLFFWALVEKQKIRGAGRVAFDAVLVLLALASVAAYFEFGWLRYDRYMNPHDVYHYYMGAKYSSEHKYFDLYRASLIADREMRSVFRERTIRNLETHRYEPVSVVLARKESIKANFRPERWEEFKKDIAYFQRTVPRYKWEAMLRDKGYNATPVWNAIARAITNQAPTDSVWAMRTLTYLDLALLALAFLSVWMAFGWRAMLFVIIFHGTNYFMSFVHIKGAFLRLDWFALTIIGLCFIKSGWYKTAGAAMAYASAARVFPLIFAYGLGCKLLYEGARRLGRREGSREHEAPTLRPYLSFFAVFVLVVMLLSGASIVADGGFVLWDHFVDKIQLHNSDISTNRAGFKYVFLAGERDKAGAFDDQQALWWSIMAGMLVFVAVAMTRLKDYETVALGFVPVFFLTAPTFYYFVMLTIPLLFFLPRVKESAYAAGAAALFGISIFGYGCSLWLDHHFRLFYLLSSAMLGLCVYMVMCAFIPRWVAATDSSKEPPTDDVSPEDAWSPTPLPSGTSVFSRISRRKVAVLGAVICILLVSAGAGIAAWQGKLNLFSRTDGDAELVFVGDVMLSRNVERSLRENDRDFLYPFHLTASFTRAADIAFCNLESPISGRGEPLDKQYVFNAPPEASRGLTHAGFDIVSLANNHVLDYGYTALDDTVGYLEKEGIQHAGVVIEDDPQVPVILNARGLRVGFLAYCDPATPYAFPKTFLDFERRPAAATREILERDITALRPKVDVLVVSMHWGIEYRPPNEHQRRLGRFIIDQGADIVAGHHPHIQQEPEVYKDKLILYSMGNFVFDQHTRPATRVSRLYRVFVNEEGVVRAEYLPLIIPKGRWQPTPTSNDWKNVYETAEK